LKWLPMSRPTNIHHSDNAEHGFERRFVRVVVETAI
jgi:hypothetical protein